MKNLGKKNKKNPTVFTLEDVDEPYRMLVESLFEGVVMLNNDLTIEHCNKQFAKMMGLKRQELRGRSFFDFFLVKERRGLKNFLATWKVESNQGKFRLKKGSSLIKDVLLSCHDLQFGATNRLAIVVTDITELQKAYKAMEKLVHFDPLTKLPNRYWLEDMLAKSMARAHRNQSVLALFYLDIDYFKNVNDLLGHSIGDMLLQEVSDRLKECVRHGDSIIRLGGDEFAILFENVPNITTVSRWAESIVEAFTNPFCIGENEIIATLSIGVSVYSHGLAIDNNMRLMQQADQALYQAKAAGRNCYMYYGKGMRQKLSRYMSIVKQLRTAVQENQLELLYQPKIDIQQNRIVGLEALVRWHNPHIKNCLPSEFIVIAEETGLIHPIGEWILKTALLQYKAWYDVEPKMKKIKLSINISANQLENGEMIKMVTQLVKKNKIPRANILFELTETALLKRTLTSEPLLKQHLLKLGICISIDDFGTGHSSLIYLKQLPIKEIKIDKSFIDDIGKDKNNEDIIKAIIQLGNILNLNVVAEGVETQKQLNFLMTNQCQIIQGYCFSKPLSAAEVLVYLDQWNKKITPSHPQCRTLL